MSYVTRETLTTTMKQEQEKTNPLTAITNMDYTYYQLQTPVIMIEGLYYTTPENRLLDEWRACGYAYSLYKVWEEYRPKQTLRTLLLK